MAVIASGLAVDVDTELPGQALLSLAVWLVLFQVLAGVQARERHALLACMVIATLGELFLSLVWGLYTYRLGNVPFFVPAGHVMLLVLATGVAQRMSERAANVILGSAAAYALAAAAAGIDTFALPLFAMLAAIAIAMPLHRRLYASTFMLALALELYGTWLGNWTWAREVPVLSLVTTNPPAIASAFYAVLDAIVVCSTLLIARRFSAARRVAFRGQ